MNHAFLVGTSRGRRPYEHLGVNRPRSDLWSLLHEEMSPAFAEAKAKFQAKTKAVVA
jgi:hypothetical protein